MTDFSMLDKDHPERFDPAEQQRGEVLPQGVVRCGEATGDGRRQVAINMLEAWRSAANFNRYDYSEKTLEERHRADKLLEEILQLMGVDS